MEEQVVAALRNSEISESQQKHIEECPVCREVIYVCRWMRQLNRERWEEKMAGKVLPRAEEVWRGILGSPRRRRELVRKAMRPMVIPQILSWGMLIFGAVFLLLSRGKDIGNFLGGGLEVISRILPYFLIPLAVVMGSILVCTFASVLDKKKRTT
jgi:hypothetical protein